MPIYEYFCLKCNKKFSLLEGVGTYRPERACPRCKNTELRKLFSKFSVARSEEAILESIADPSGLSGLDENDPKSVARWAKKIGKELGEDMGEEIDEMVEKELAGDASGSDDDKIY